MTWILGIVALVLLALGGLLWFLSRKLKALRIQREDEVSRALAGQEIRFRDPSANFFGVESLGRTQVRGNGILTVTGEGVHFLMWVPRREFWVPAEKITGVETARAHLGKTMGRDLVKLTYINPDGAADSGAWLTGRKAEAEAAIRAIMP